MTIQGTFLSGKNRKVNGHAPEKVAFRIHILQVKGYAPEKSGVLSDYIHFYVLLGTNGHQKEAFFTLSATDYSPGILNGYAPEYVHTPSRFLPSGALG